MEHELTESDLKAISEFGLIRFYVSFQIRSDMFAQRLRHIDQIDEKTDVHQRETHGRIHEQGMMMT